MARPTSKKDLEVASNEKYEKLMELINNMSDLELKKEFDFSKDEKKKEAHWNRDKNLRDVVIHLYEWHKLLLNWVNNNLSGNKQQFLLEPYNWRTYGQMNIDFWEKHQNTPLEKAIKDLNKSHSEVMELLEKFSNEELFSKDVFEWVGGSTLGSYFVSATASHYDWAIKKIRAHKKNCKDDIK